MPGRDRTGPQRRGAISGRGYGNCRGVNVRGSANHRLWRGLAMNVRGGGWSHRSPGGYGWCRSQARASGPVRMRAMGWSWPDDAPPDNVLPDNLPIDKEALKQRMQALQSEMAAIKKQLEGLEEGKEEEVAENVLIAGRPQSRLG